MRQRGITVITEIKEGKVASLKALLNQVGDDIDGNGLINFYKIETVHFMRWVVLDASMAGGRPTPPQLVLATNYDGSTDAHLMEIVTKAGPGLEAIYGHCKGFPGCKDPRAVLGYFKQNKVRNAAFYCGTPGRSVRQIHWEAKLRNEIQDYLQESNPSQDWSRQPLRQIRKGISSNIFGKPEYNWVLNRPTSLFLQKYGVALLLTGLFIFLILYGFAWFLAPILTLVGTVAVLLGIRIWWGKILHLEKEDRKRFVPKPKAPDKVEATNSRHYRVQKQLTHIVEIKPGFIRLTTLKVVLTAIGLLARTLYNKGQLGGISTIHFARWNIIDGGRRLLFFTNFDGSWENYLGDFVDRAPLGLTAVWSNTMEFPPSKKLFWEGAQNSPQFKAWAHDKELEAQVWYSAYKYFTTHNIDTNSRIRNGIIGNLSQSKTEEWLQLL